MKTAVIAIIEDNLLGQSIGCLAPLKKEMRLGRFMRVCNRMADGRPRGRVSVNIIGGHFDIPGSCISISFHFTPSPHPIQSADLSRRADVIRSWLRDEFNVEAFDEKMFPSRVEFCDYLRDPLAVM